MNKSTSTSKGEQTRERILTTTLDLIENQGFFSTGLQQIIKVSGTPRGSLYFHFPGGKDELVAEALAQGAQLIQALLEQAFVVSPGLTDAVDLIVQGLLARLQASDYQKGCPVATVALEVGAGHPLVRKACEKAYENWITCIASGLRNGGFGARQATAEAELVLAMIEGALMLAKVKRNPQPLQAAGDAIKQRLALAG